MLNLSENKILSIANLADTEQIQFINLQNNYICEFEQLLKWKKANFEWIGFQNILDVNYITLYQLQLIKGKNSQNAYQFVVDLNTKQQLSYKAFKDNYVQYQTEKYKQFVISYIDRNGKSLSEQDDKMMFEFGFTQQYENCNRLIFIKCENISLFNSPLNLHSLTLNSYHIKSLEGIQTMRTLVVLNISDNQIENLEIYMRTIINYLYGRSIEIKESNLHQYYESQLQEQQPKILDNRIYWVKKLCYPKTFSFTDVTKQLRFLKPKYQRLNKERTLQLSISAQKLNIPQGSTKILLNSQQSQICSFVLFKN
ncbi:Leucine-rich_repeat domain superfamily [Hexamita inflata]|uniref:Leucine-rich repeat domain superfamily n=1 Tax=Hexamita inflata TaxID=28002 RepID=A0AA86Q7Q5_9EUKA|nr:Leucine-rich repeat domain superfamily [Hexamita inflata]